MIIQNKSYQLAYHIYFIPCTKFECQMNHRCLNLFQITIPSCFPLSVKYNYNNDYSISLSFFLVDIYVLLQDYSLLCEISLCEIYHTPVG